MMRTFDYEGTIIHCDITPEIEKAEERLRVYGEVDGLTKEDAEAVFLLHGDYSGWVSLTDDGAGGWGVAYPPETCKAVCQ